MSEDLPSMSIFEHLGELRTCILRALTGFGIVFLLCVLFSDRLWLIVQAPASGALKKLGARGDLVILDPMEGFSIIWMWTPVVASIFLASPWILYQLWAFIAPALYERERRWAVPFVLTTAGLFVAGGCFAYFVIVPFGMAFLLGAGGFAGVVPMVSIDLYFSRFVDVMLGVAIVFETPLLIFFLTLLHLASPRFLLRHSNYAILGIVVIASIVTPTQDALNLMLVAVPMTLLYFVGIFASTLLVMKREGQRIPWLRWTLWSAGALVIGSAVYWAVTRLR